MEIPTDDIVLGIDFETTGLDPERDVITEVGAVLWQWRIAKPLAVYSDTIILGPGHVLTDEIQELTGITPDMVKAPIAVPESQALRRVLELAKLAKYFVAHNAKFDRAFFHAALERHSLTNSDATLPWLDTALDVPYPSRCRARSLTYLAADHAFLNPFAHRAVFDVLTMFSVAKHYPLATLVEWNASPTVRLVGTFPREQNEAAKACGFRWDPDRRQWYREVKQCQIPALKIDVAYYQAGMG